MKISIIKVILISLFLLTFIFAQTPLLLNYQGKLFDQDSEPLNTTTDITFKIFSAETEGSELWFETHTSVAVSNGVFNVMLGSVTALSADLFTGAGSRYLEITVDSETLSPRFQLVSVAYAIRAAVADSVQDGAINTQQLRDGAVTQIKLDAGITAIPSGSAGGDLNGTYPNPSVNGILGRTISSTAPANGQVLKYNDGASQWEPANDISGGDGTVSTTARLTGDGSSTTPLDIAQQGATTNQVLQWNGSTWIPGTISVSGGNTLDQAYDQGGAGAGRVITADNGAVNIAGAGGLTVEGDVSVTGDVSANAFSGIGTLLTSLNATNLSSGIVADARLETDIARTVISASERMGIGTNTPLNGYGLHMVSNNDNIGMYMDYNQTSANAENYGIYLDFDNTNTGSSANYGIFSDVYKTGGTYPSYGLFSQVDGSSTHTGLRVGLFGRADNDDNSATVYGINGIAAGDGTGTKRGVYGSATGAGTASGVYGSTTGTGTYTYGVYGQGAGSGSNSYGVYGLANGTATNTYGLYGNASGSSTETKYGAYGTATGDGIVYGLYGNVNSANQYSQAVRGVNGTITGLLAGSDRGLEGYYDSNHWGFIAGASYGAYLVGNVRISGDLTVTGALSKGSGTFKIDHPLEPENKYLNHSFVESPDMKNIYDGVVVLNDSGEATVNLPEWFSALNISYRYQLTAIGAPGPNLYISREISDNQFSIAGGTSGMKVSWQVTGIRNDAYAKKHPIIVEEEKPQNKRGKYLHPDAFNLPETMNEETLEKPLNIKQSVDE